MSLLNIMLALFYRVGLCFVEFLMVRHIFLRPYFSSGKRPVSEVGADFLYVSSWDYKLVGLGAIKLGAP